MRKQAIFKLFLLLGASILILAACGKTTPPEEEAPTEGLVITPETINVEAGETIDFNFEALGLPAGLSSVLFEWNFGDGKSDSTGHEEVSVRNGRATLSRQHIYGEEGAFGVWVRVSDPDDDEEVFVGHKPAVVGDDIDVEKEYELDICDSWVAADSGGYGYTVHHWDLSDIPQGAAFDIDYDALSQPDRYFIEYPAGNLVHDTGWRGSPTYEGDPQFPGGIAGPGKGSEEDLFVKGSSNDLKITIIGGEPGTIWHYDIQCRTN